MNVDASTVDAIVDRLHVGLDTEPECVREQVIAIYAQFENVRVHAYLPVLVEKQLKERLRHLRQITAATSGTA